MVKLSLYLEADGMLNDVDKSKIVNVDGAVRVGVLPVGTQSGRPSVGIAFELPNGQVVLAQTTLRLFHIAAKAFAAKYGWQDDDKEGQERNG